MSNANDAIRLMKPEVDSICKTTKIVLRECKQPSTRTDESDYQPRSLPKRIFQTAQDWVNNREYDKVCELTSSLEAILDDEGIAITELKSPSPATIWQRSLCELTLLMADLSDAIPQSIWSSSCEH